MRASASRDSRTPRHSPAALPALPLGGARPPNTTRQPCASTKPDMPTPRRSPAALPALPLVGARPPNATRQACASCQPDTSTPRDSPAALSALPLGGAPLPNTTPQPRVVRQPRSPHFCLAPRISPTRHPNPASRPSHPLGSLTSRRVSAFSEAKASRKVSTPSTQRVAEACSDLSDRLAPLTRSPGGPVLNPKTQGVLQQTETATPPRRSASRNHRVNLQR